MAKARLKRLKLDRGILSLLSSSSEIPELYKTFRRLLFSHVMTDGIAEAAFQRHRGDRQDSMLLPHHSHNLARSHG